MKRSHYTNYDQLPLFLNAELVSKTLGIAPSSAYELMHEKDFPTLRIGSRMVVPKDRFIEWVVQHTKGGGCEWAKPGRLWAGSGRRIVSPCPTSCCNSICLPVLSPCTFTCCATPTVERIGAIPAKRLWQKSCISPAIP